jgi:hypothetical protein
MLSIEYSGRLVLARYAGKSLRESTLRKGELGLESGVKLVEKREISIW